MVGRPENEVKSEVFAKDTELENILKDLRNNKTDVVRLVKHLEGDSYKEDEHSMEFCTAYAITIIQKYCKNTSKEEVKQAGGGIVGSAEDKSELLLAACGFLRGFTDVRQGERCQKYYDYAHGYNQFLRRILHGEGSVTATLRPILKAITWELTNTLYDLKTKNGGELGFLDQVPKELTLPAPRSGGKPGQQPTSEPSSLWEQIKLRTLAAKSSLTVSKCLGALSSVVVAVSLVKIAFFPAPSPSQVEVNDYLFESKSANVLVEELISTQPEVTVYPGVVTPLPIEVLPSEAHDAYLLCASSDNIVLRGIDGTVARVKAMDDFEPSEPRTEVIVTVTPLYSAPSNPSIEVPVVVDYTATIPEPLR